MTVSLRLVSRMAAAGVVLAMMPSGFAMEAVTDETAASPAVSNPILLQRGGPTTSASDDAAPEGDQTTRIRMRKSVRELREMRRLQRTRLRDALQQRLQTDDASTITPEHRLQRPEPLNVSPARTLPEDMDGGLKPRARLVPQTIVRPYLQPTNATLQESTTDR